MPKMPIIVALKIVKDTATAAANHEWAKRHAEASVQELLALDQALNIIEDLIIEMESTALELCVEDLKLKPNWDAVDTTTGG